MSPRKVLIPLLLLAALAGSHAQDMGEHRHGGGARPPESATPEERRAFWQARAAQRDATLATGSAAASAATAAAAATPPAGPAHPARSAVGKPVTAPAAAAAAAAAGRGDGPPPARTRPGFADNLLWLSDLPPRRDGARGGRGGMGGMGNMADMSGMGGMGGAPGNVPSKRLWLRSGGNPLTARNLPASEAALLLDPHNQATTLAVEAHGGPYNVSFPMPDPGVYNIYFVQQAVDQDNLNLTVAKAEVMRSAGHAKAEGEAQLMQPRTDPRVPVEIIRQRKADEGLFTRINYGDTLTFQVLRQGKPVQNARVTFTSGQGWSSSQLSDEDGKATFVVIRDYFPDWNDFDRRHRETFLVSASFGVEQSGEWQGGSYRNARYTTSLAGAYYPSSNDYESYAWGLGVGLLGLLFSGSAIYLYRRRRLQPYREVKFDE